MLLKSHILNGENTTEIVIFGWTKKIADENELLIVCCL